LLYCNSMDDLKIIEKLNGWENWSDVIYLFGWTTNL